jgi:hypothetical protein
LTLRKSEIKARIGTLTDALIDRLIDKEAFAERKQHLLIECQKIDDQLAKMNDLTAEADKLAKFLELVKSLAELYQIANPSEKRLIVELATSNRLVDGKNVVLQPSNWLLTVDMAVTALCGGHYRDTSRTPTKVQIRQFEQLEAILAEPEVFDMVQQLSDIMDKYNGTAKSAAKKVDSSQFGSLPLKE